MEAKSKGLNQFKKKKRAIVTTEKPFQLIKNSKHLSYIAGIVGVSVVVAKLVDYLFSDFASSRIPDPDSLATFFAFWFSTFNLISLGIQLFFTRRIVGVWGVGFSLGLLPFGIFIGCLIFLVFPELIIVILIKAIDATMKQSIHKSAIELLSLPLPFDLKNKTKSYIDVVVDSIATGIAGFILIFIVKGLDLGAFYISVIILLLVIIWIYFVYKVRLEYFNTFRENLALITEKNVGSKNSLKPKGSVLNGMKTVFAKGTESQVLFMLNKLLEINDKRFAGELKQLLKHPSNKIKIAAIENLYYLNNVNVLSEVPELLRSNDENLVLATLEYVLLRQPKNNHGFYKTYLDHENKTISNAALLCLAREAKNNYSLKQNYNLDQRLAQQISYIANNKADISTLKFTLRTIGNANLQKYYPFLQTYLKHKDQDVLITAIYASGLTLDPLFVKPLMGFLTNKTLREPAQEALLNFGNALLPTLVDQVQARDYSIEICRRVPGLFEIFNSQEAITQLLLLINDRDLSIRLEVIRSLSNIKRKSTKLKFNRYKVVRMILEECKLYQKTLSALHTQIIQQYRNRKRTKEVVSEEERNARSVLLDLLEHRLDSSLERIFKLLGLKYQQKDVEIAYSGLTSEKHEARNNAIEFLDNLLTGDLKRKLIPIIENTVLDITSDEVIQKIQQKILSEFECFKLLLEANDVKLKRAVLYLIKIENDKKYVPLVETCAKSNDEKIKLFAIEVLENLQN